MASPLTEACDGCIRVMGRASGPSTRRSIRRPDAPTAERRRGPQSTYCEPPGWGISSHPGSSEWTGATAARVGASPKLSRRPAEGGTDGWSALLGINLAI
jgi:hypothetical protein